GPTPAILTPAAEDMATIVRCIQAGAEDYLPKPFNPTLLKARVTATLEKKRLRDQEQEYQRQIEEYNQHLEERVAEQVREISSAQLAAIFALSKLAESRDPETGEHLERMREYCRILAEELARRDGYAAVITGRFVEDLYAAAPLHDIGKVGIPDYILQKPGSLTEHEKRIMQGHTLIGAATLRAVDERHPGNGFIRLGIEIAESH